MMQVSINRFYKGVDYDSSDMDVSREHAREIVNARLVNTDGQGFILVPYKSTEQAFSLSPGYYPVGACSYNGIAYILSTNGTNGEIGTFPSPNWGPTDQFGNPCTPGFVNQYKPLYNFFNGAVPPIGTDTRDPFNTPLLSLDGQVECFARIDYDNSVNIYFTDNVNPVRKINSGFDQDGICTGRSYNNSSFPGDINLLKSFCSRPVIELNEIQNGGVVKYGNYFFFIRYATDGGGTRTDFISSTNAVQAGTQVSASGPVTSGGYPDDSTGNKILLDLSNLDTSFDFYEIGFIRFFDDSFEVKLIDITYPISNTTDQLTIIGSEPLVNFTLEELIATRTSYDIAKTITQLENRLWMGNLKSSSGWDPRLVELARAIVVRPSTFWPGASRIEEDHPYTPPSNINIQRHLYHRHELQHESVGYFRSETYKFAIIFVTKDGKETQPFPVRGYDAWFDPSATAIWGGYNYDGVLRMPSNHQSPYMSAHDPNGVSDIELLGVGFDWNTPDANNGGQTANDILALYQSYFDSEICGFYYVRADRKPNLEYQGVQLGVYSLYDDNVANPDVLQVANPYSLQGSNIINSYSPVVGPNATFKTHLIPAFNYRTGLTNPILKPLIPLVENLNLTAQFIPNTNGLFKYTRTNHYGIFSSDQFFDNSYNSGIKTVIVQGYYNCSFEPQVSGFLSNAPQLNSNPFTYNIYPNFIWDQIGFNSRLEPLGGISPNTIGVGNIGIVDFDTNSPGSFSSKIPFKELCRWKLGGADVAGNRNITLRRYLGLVYDPTDPNHIVPSPNDVHQDSIPLDPNNGRPIVNIYSVNPVPQALGGSFLINNWYSGNQIYYRITGIINSPQNPALPSSAVYGGDCFIQRVYFKEMHSEGEHEPNLSNESAYEPGTLSGPRLRYWTYGNMYSVVTENKYNLAMRGYEKNASNTAFGFNYPKFNRNNPWVFMGQLQTSDRESRYYNKGFHRNNIPVPYIGFDPSVPPPAKKLETRIAYSDFHTNSSQQDAYTFIKPISFKDFDYQYGPINKIGEFNGKLYSVQDSAINIHYVNERQALSPAEGQQIILGDGEILSQKQSVISNGIGSQHQFSIIHSDGSVYGVDVFKRSIWALTPNGIDVISDSKLARTKIFEICNTLIGDITNASNRFPDQPAISTGIASYYDRRNKEIGWTFKTDNGDLTIVYKEPIGAFQGENTFNSRMYITTNEDLISFDPDNINDAYLHDLANDYLRFYSRPNTEDMRVDFLLNDKAEVTRVFDNLEISSNGEVFKEAIFETEDQVTIKPWIEGLNYKDPVYIENKWKLPIPRTQTQTGSTNNQYGIRSRFRGKFAKVTLKYSNQAYQYIRDVISKFRISRT